MALSCPSTPLRIPLRIRMRADLLKTSVRLTSSFAVPIEFEIVGPEIAALNSDGVAAIREREVNTPPSHQRTEFDRRRVGRAPLR
jgi:hypothetical protein